MPSWLSKLRNQGLALQAAALVVAVVAAYALAAPVAGLLSGTTGLASAAVAAGVCLGGAISALLVCRVTNNPQKAWIGVLAGMLPRMGIPLGIALFLQMRGGVLVEAGLLYYLVLFYMVTLALETAITLPGGDSAHPTNQVSQDAPL